MSESELTTGVAVKKILWFSTGLALGASAALLMAPASGKDTRGTLKSATNEGGAALASSGKDVFERGREFFEQGRQIALQAADIFEKGRTLIDSTAAHLRRD